jgi:hypothetical protein
MNSQHIFPRQALATGLSEPSIKLEGHKVVFDKKVSLLPANIRKEDTKKIKIKNGTHRQPQYR